MWGDILYMLHEHLNLSLNGLQGSNNCHSKLNSLSHLHRLKLNYDANLIIRCKEFCLNIMAMLNALNLLKISTNNVNRFSFNFRTLQLLELIYYFSSLKFLWKMFSKCKCKFNIWYWKTKGFTTQFYLEMDCYSKIIDINWRHHLWVNCWSTLCIHYL